MAQRLARAFSMALTRRLIPTLVLPLFIACGGDEDRNQPMFTSGSASMGSETVGEGGTNETSGSSMDAGDGDPGDGDPGDGDPGDGDPGDGDPGDGDPGDGDGDGGDGDGEPMGCMSDPMVVGTSCGQGSAYHGSYGLGQMNTDMPVGIIDTTDNGPGNGAEDWYQVDFPIDMNNPRPFGGMATINFDVNSNNDYRFEVFRDCGAQPYGQGLASEFGPNSPPLTEWSFNDLDLGEEQAAYIDNVLWPTTVWIRVFRFQNDGECSTYQLQVMRN
jgi:hypothetical protein